MHLLIIAAIQVPHFTDQARVNEAIGGNQVVTECCFAMVYMCLQGGTRCALPRCDCNGIVIPAESRHPVHWAHKNTQVPDALCVPLQGAELLDGNLHCCDFV